MAIREQVQTALGTLPGAEKKIAHAFLANYPSIGLSTIAELAALAGTSAPTVLRFVARLGFESYPEFPAGVAQRCAGAVDVAARTRPHHRARHRQSGAQGQLRERHGQSRGHASGRAGKRVRGCLRLALRPQVGLLPAGGPVHRHHRRLHGCAPADHPSECQAFWRTDVDMARPIARCPPWRCRRPVRYPPLPVRPGPAWGTAGRAQGPHPADHRSLAVADRAFGPRGAALRGRCQPHLGFEHHPDGGRRSAHRPGFPRPVGSRARPHAGARRHPLEQPPGR
jgi:hypothetical protein